MSSVVSNNLISPWSTPIAYTPEKKHGFLCTPKSTQYPDGWGKPFVDGNGHDVPPPGTPGGTANIKSLQRYTQNSGTWESRFKPGDYSFGNIDWTGNSTGSLDDTGKVNYVVTFHGPPARYFRNEDFVYGSKEAHNEIYSNGRIIAVAPSPVLGACLQSVAKPDGTKTVYVVAICTSGLTDKVYARPLAEYRVSPVTGTSRDKAMQLYDPASNNKGWVLVGENTLQASSTNGETIVEMKKPGSPWFFNAKGDESQCIRESDIQFDGGYGKTISETKFTRFRVKIPLALQKVEASTNLGISEHYKVTENVAVFDEPQEKPPYRVSITISKTTSTLSHDHVWFGQNYLIFRNPVTEAPTLPAGDYVSNLYYLEYEYTAKGKQPVCVDYVNGNVVVGYAEVNHKSRWVLSCIEGVSGPSGNRAEGIEWAFMFRQKTNLVWEDGGSGGTLKTILLHIMQTMSRYTYETGLDKNDYTNYTMQLFAIVRRQVELKYLDIRKSRFLIVYGMMEDVAFDYASDIHAAGDTWNKYLLHNEVVIDRNERDAEDIVFNEIKETSAPFVTTELGVGTSGNPGPYWDDAWTTAKAKNTYAEGSYVMDFQSFNLKWPEFDTPGNRQKIEGVYVYKNFLERAKPVNLQDLLCGSMVDSHGSKLFPTEGGFATYVDGSKFFSVKYVNDSNEDKYKNHLAKDAEPSVDIPGIIGGGEYFYPLATK